MFSKRICSYKELFLRFYYLLLDRIGEDLQIKQMSERDTRMKQMTEILSGVKVLKLYAWEPPFMDRINKIREKEIGFLRTMVKLYVCCINFTFACSPFLVTVAVFGVYVLAYPTEILTAEKVKECI